MNKKQWPLQTLGDGSFLFDSLCGRFVKQKRTVPECLNHRFPFVMYCANSSNASLKALLSKGQLLI